MRFLSVLIEKATDFLEAVDQNFEGVEQDDLKKKLLHVVQNLHVILNSFGKVYQEELTRKLRAGCTLFCRKTQRFRGPEQPR